MQPNFFVDGVEINFVEFKALEAPDELRLKFEFIRFGSDVLHLKINVQIIISDHLNDGKYFSRLRIFVGDIDDILNVIGKELYFLIR